MPIKKRKNIPEPKAAKVSVFCDGFKPPGRRIDHLIKEHDRIASDADWKGDEIKAKHHQDIANRFRERLAAGELYDVEF